MRLLVGEADGRLDSCLHMHQPHSGGNPRPTRTARTAWNGTLETGSGQGELTSSKVGTFYVSFPKRAADEAGGTTSPDELIAARAHTCYAMQFSALLAQAGGTPRALDVQADVTLGPDKGDGGLG